MRQFFKFLFASCFGFILAGLVILLIGSIVVTRMVASAEKPAGIKPNSVIHLTLSETLPERTNNQTIDFNEFQTEPILGLHDIARAIRQAAKDDDIQGIFLDMDNFANGQVSGATIRDALLDFKESGKFILAYSNYYTQSTYAVASVADEIYVHPMGGVDFRGFAAFIPYFKDMFDKLGIEWQVVYKGKFKSASEPYRLNEMSEANRIQVKAYLDVLYDDFLSKIAASRNLNIERLREMAANYEIRNAQDALQAGLATRIAYREEVLSDMRNRLGLSDKDKMQSPSIQQYRANMDEELPESARNQIAVIYAEGAIVDGEGEEGTTGSRKYTRMIREIREKDKTRAIVLRVNSPGGSALASEDIWHELQLAREEGIPVIASMGDLAASGGYYISCGADSILADPSTLTGSIGVVGMIPNMSELLDQKLGIHFDTVLTGPYADGISPFFPIDKKTWNILDHEIDSLYTVFKSRVAMGRSLSMDSVEAIAQGRVWAGRDALAVGLVDQMGDLQDAIDMAAYKAGIDEYLLIEYPKIKDPLMQLMEMVLGKEDKDQVRAALIEAELGEYAPYYRYLKELKDMEGPQARLPFFIEFR